MMITKSNLSPSIPVQIEQGQNMAARSRATLAGPQPLVDDLDAKTATLAEKQAAALSARAASAQATADVVTAAGEQRVSVGNLAAHVNTVADGNYGVIRGCGFEVRSSAMPKPPLDVPPGDLATSVNGVPRRVYVTWKGVAGARNYEVQHTKDLSYASGWETLPETPGKTRAEVNGLDSGTKYAFRVRALGNGAPGPYCSPIQQVAV